MQNDNLAKKDLKSVNDGKVTSSQSSHPVGTTLGTVTGMAAGVGGAVIASAAAGATAGTVVGPVGAAAGAIIGGMVGAGTGHEIAAQINPKDEDLFWRANFSSRSYVKPGSDYETYRPAYTYGVDSFTRNQGRSFDDIADDLGSQWNTRRGDSKLDWNEAKWATRDAFTRLSNHEE